MATAEKVKKIYEVKTISEFKTDIKTGELLFDISVLNAIDSMQKKGLEIEVLYSTACNNTGHIYHVTHSAIILGKK